MDQASYTQQLIKDIIGSLEKHGAGNCLSSVILTGSFGRDEPTYMVKDNGDVTLKSDVEIVLLFPDISKKKKIKELILQVSSEFDEELNFMPVHEKRVKKAYNFNFSLKAPKYKTVFTYDLYHGSKTIWGRDFLKEKKITLSDIDPYETKRLVANRIGELCYLEKGDREDARDYLRKQWKGKVVLAIASAWLICERNYVSSYHGQYVRLKKNRKKAERLLGTGFFDEYQNVFSFLRENGGVYEIPDERLRGYVKQMDRYFKEKGFRRSKVNSVSRWAKYILKYLKTGMKYGLAGFEDNILQALIGDYWRQSGRLDTDADVWHKVLY